MTLTPGDGHTDAEGNVPEDRRKDHQDQVVGSHDGQPQVRLQRRRQFCPGPTAGARIIKTFLCVRRGCAKAKGR